MHLLFFVVARVGFEAMDYFIREDGGHVFFRFGVLEGNITFPVSILFSVMDGSATGMHTTFQCFHNRRFLF